MIFTFTIFCFCFACLLSLSLFNTDCSTKQNLQLFHSPASSSLATPMIFTFTIFYFCFPCLLSLSLFNKDCSTKQNMQLFPSPASSGLATPMIFTFTIFHFCCPCLLLQNFCFQQNKTPALSLSCFVGLGNTKDRDKQPKIDCPANPRYVCVKMFGGGMGDQIKRWQKSTKTFHSNFSKSIMSTSDRSQRKMWKGC